MRTTPLTPDDTPWHALPSETVAERLQVDIDAGLSPAEAARRLQTTGPNAVRAPRRVTLLGVLGEEVREPMILLLLAVAGLYALTGELAETATVSAVIAFVVLVESWNEYRAKRAIQLLPTLDIALASVRREGRILRIPTEEVVPGDVVLLRPGDRVPADARLLASAGLVVDESILTGESVPGAKSPEPVDADTPVADRRGMVWSATTVASGTATAIVVATGMTSLAGEALALARATREPRTPLQLEMRRLAKSLVYVAFGLSVLVPVVGVAAGLELRDMVLTGLALAFATVPEELPVLVTLILGIGAMRLASSGVIVKRLRAIESLGAVTTVATDKTGTLTTGTLSVTEVVTPAGRVWSWPAVQPPADVVALLATCAEANEAAPTAGESTVPQLDPIDVALAAAASSTGQTSARPGRQPGARVSVVYNAELRAQVGMVSTPTATRAIVRGAPEFVLALGADATPELHAAAAQLAASGRRVVAVASGAYAGDPARAHAAGPDAFRDLTPTGLVALSDPPRPDVRTALSALAGAGVRTVVVTGDHLATALHLLATAGMRVAAGVVGADQAALAATQHTSAASGAVVFARITPRQKLAVIEALRAAGEVVAAVGDGYNDAPALRAADVGVAPGQSSCDAARDAAAMILRDDSLLSFVDAVREARTLVANLRGAIGYYLATKVALVLACAVGAGVFATAVFSPIQIIFIELILDVAAGLAFTGLAPAPDAMLAPPRDPHARLLGGRSLARILLGGAALAGGVLPAFGSVVATDPARASSLALVVWLMGHVLLACLVIAADGRPARSLVGNPTLVAWVGAAVALAWLVGTNAGAAAIVGAVPLAAGDWATALAATTLVGLVWLVGLLTGVTRDARSPRKAVS